MKEYLNIIDNVRCYISVVDKIQNQVSVNDRNHKYKQIIELNPITAIEYSSCYKQLPYGTNIRQRNLQISQ